MATPRRKTSTCKRNQRRSHDALTVTTSTKCSNCGELKLPHNVCKTCGFYGKKQVVEK